MSFSSQISDQWSFIPESVREALSSTALFSPLLSTLLSSGPALCIAPLEPCLRPWPPRSPGAGGWRWLPSSRTCCSPPCCWDGGRSSSCSSRRGSTLTSATRRRVSKQPSCFSPCSLYVLRFLLPFSHWNEDWRRRGQPVSLLPLPFSEENYFSVFKGLWRLNLIT